MVSEIALKGYIQIKYFHMITSLIKYLIHFFINNYFTNILLKFSQAYTNARKEALVE